MRHPEEKYNLEQEKALKGFPPEKRAFFELMFKIGNASVVYHAKARESEPTEADWKEWIDGLSEPAKSGFRTMGFEKCKSAFPFTRYVNEKNDIGFDEFLKINLSEADYESYRKINDQP